MAAKTTSTLGKPFVNCGGVHKGFAQAVRAMKFTSGAERTFWWEEDLSEASVSRTLSASSNLACSMSQLTLSSPSLGLPTTMSCSDQPTQVKP